jgi:membrane fusion protein, multidrug efflux system
MKSVSLMAATILILAFARGNHAVRAGDGPSASSTAKVVKLKDCLIKAVNQASLATERPGVVEFIGPKEGDIVRKNEILARLTDAVPKANLEVARLTADSAVEIEYAKLLNAVDEVEYEKAVFANQRQANAVTDIEVRRLKLAADRSRLQIDKADHETKINVMKAVQAEAELKTYWIQAPFDGVVTRVQKQRGEAVKQGEPLLEIMNTDKVRVEGLVNDIDIWNVKVGSQVEVRLSVTPDLSLPVEQQIFKGRIGFVDVGGSLKDTRVWAQVDNPDNILRPGLNATMTITPAAAGNAAP